MALAGVVVVGLAGMAYVWNAGDPPQSAPVLAVASEPTDAILVHVSGAVIAPGVVSIPSSSRVADAVAAAGGVTGDAVLTAINLAAVVQDGQQVIVPTQGAAQAETDGRIASMSQRLWSCSPCLASARFWRPESLRIGMTSVRLA